LKEKDDLKGKKVPPARERVRNAAASRAAILQAALHEFSEAGYDGARVDKIARAAHVSKPLLYDYFGSKEQLYAHALREAYVQIRAKEQKFNVLSLAPQEAIRAFVQFTIRHFARTPWFIRILNTENLRKGSSIGLIDDRKLIQSTSLGKMSTLLKRGYETGVFCRQIEPFDLYLMIASLCYFPVSNRHTLESVFDYTFSEENLAAHAERSASMILSWLRTKDDDSLDTESA